MPFWLDLLPPEILSGITPLIGADDIISLNQCVPLIVSKKVYNHVFHDPRRPSHYDLETFKKRACAKLYGVGTCFGDDEDYEYIGNSQFQRMHTPYMMKGAGVVVRATVSESSPFVLNARGEALQWKVSELQPLEARQTFEDDYEAVLPAPADVPIFNAPYKPTGFVGLSTGDEKIALDADGLLWFWKGDKGRPVVLVENGELVTGRILELRDCMHHLTCIVEGRGVVCATELLFNLVHNGDRSGHLCHLEVQTERGTADARNYAFVRSHLVCLQPDGSLTVTREQDEDVCLAIAEINRLGCIVQMAASATQLDFLTADGRVIDLSADKAHEAYLVPRVMEVPGKVVSVAVGKAHCLALTRSGDVYSWGMEEQANGCLGLGRLEDVLKLEGAHWEGDEVELLDEDSYFWLAVDKPTKVDLPGKAYAISAQDGCSVFLVGE